MIRVKELASLSNLKKVLANKGFDNIEIEYFDFIIDGRITWVEIEGILFKLWSKNTFKRIACRWGAVLHVDDQEDGCLYRRRMCIKTKVDKNIFESFKIIFRGKIFWIRAKEVLGWVPNLFEDNKEDYESDWESKEGYEDINKGLSYDSSLKYPPGFTPTPDMEEQNKNNGESKKVRKDSDQILASLPGRNSGVYDPNPNSFDCPPDSYHPPHPIYETYSGDSCGNDSHFGYDCPPRFPLNYEPEPGYIRNYNFYLHDSPSFPQQYLCCDNCGGPHETFQCQPINHNFYNSNSSSFDQSQTPQFPFIHPPPQETSIEILYDQENEINSVETFLRKFNRYSFFETPKVFLLTWDRVFKIKDALGNKQYKPKDTQELFRELFNDVQNIHEELAEYINTLGWNHPAFYNNGDDDDEDCTIAITSDFLITDSLSMGDERL
nr:glucose-methanol-choline oxidoreductase, FAD/NAD(P)-binding domain protein [Tanacetum cinerariifolium]